MIKEMFLQRMLLIHQKRNHCEKTLDNILENLNGKILDLKVGIVQIL